MKRPIYRSGKNAGRLVGGVIYIISTSKAPGVYIGQTREAKPESRWRAHLIAARTGKAGKLYDAMRTHGSDSFSFQVIASVPEVKHLTEVEAALIEQYDAEENGYNATGPKKWAAQRAELAPLHSALYDALNRLGAERVINILNAAT